MAKEYRSRPRITLEILRAVKAEPGVGMTRLLLIANMSTERLQSYLADMATRGLVTEALEDGRRRYWITTDGQRVLTELEKIDRFMANFGMGL